MIIMYIVWVDVFTGTNHDIIIISHPRQQDGTSSQKLSNKKEGIECVEELKYN